MGLIDLLKVRNFFRGIDDPEDSILTSPILVEDVSQVESETSFEFQVITDSAISTTLEFSVVATGSNATTPIDFLGGVNPSGEVEIVDGVGTVSFEVANDNLIEGDETFRLLVSNPAGNNRLVGTAIGTIEEDPEDSILTSPVLVEDVSQVESETSFEFQVITDSAISTTLEFSVVATGSNATTPIDFLGGVNPSGEVEIVDGVGTVSFEVANDNLIEGDETFQLLVSNPLDDDKLVASAIGTIEEDPEDSILTSPVLVEDVSQVESETSFEFQVITDSAISTTLEFSVVATGSNATTPIDFLGGVNPSGEVEIVDGVGTVSFEVANDNLIEGDETFQLLVSNPLDDDKLVASAIGTILDNDTDLDDLMLA